MHGDNWYNFMTYETWHTMFFLPYIHEKMYLNSILHHNQGQELHIWNFVDTLLCTIASARFTAQYALFTSMFAWFTNCGNQTA